MTPIVCDAKGLKLSRLIAKRFRVLSRDLENNGLRIGGIVDHLANAQRVVSSVRHRSHLVAQCAFVIRSWAPLMKRDSSEMRKSTRFATSFGSQKRDLGSAS